MRYRFIRIEEGTQGVTTLWLARAEKRNAFHRQMIEEILEGLAEISQFLEHRVLVIRGEGACFCAGGDIAWMHDICNSSEVVQMQEANRIRALYEAVRTHVRPTIAAVHGGTFGGGIGLMVACDLVIAADFAKFSTSEGKLGIVPACLAPSLVRRVGLTRAKNLILLANTLSASDAERIGLVDFVDPNFHEHDQLEACVADLLAIPAETQLATKRMLREIEEKAHDDPHLLRFLAASWSSENGKEGTRAFLEQRQPEWRFS